MSNSELNEAQTRDQLVDPWLEKARWILADRTQVLREVPVDGTTPSLEWRDRLLPLQHDGTVLAVVEASVAAATSVPRNSSAIT